MLIDGELIMGECEYCGEFDCDIEHNDYDYEYDDSWLFDGSGMVGDD